MKSLETVWQDIVFATRLLQKSPIFTSAVVLTFALGIGVNTAVFSVVNAIVLRPLPVRDGDRLVVIASRDTATGAIRPVSFADLEDYRAAGAGAFEDILGYSAGFLGLAREGGQPNRVLVTWVTGNYFQLLDVQPALGRLIRPDEGGRGRVDAVVVLGYSTWRRRFGADRSVIGTVVRVNGQPCTIVGVAPSGFAGTFAFSESELYLPVNWSGGDDLFDDRRSRGLHAIARLRPGVTIERAGAAMDVVAERLSRQYPDSNRNIAVHVLPERLARPEEGQFRTNARGAAIMLGLVGLVMIVATVNVTNLLVARATSRRQELAIRSALGASRGRLVRQMVTESLLLAASGGSIGILVGTWAARLLATVRPPGDLPVRFDFHLDRRVLIYTSLMALITGLLVGLLPAMRASGADLDRTLRQSRYRSYRRHGHRISSFLVVAQISICFVLLVTAGLFARSLVDAQHADVGFQPDGVLNMHMDVGQLGYTEVQGRALFDEIERSVRAISGVEHVSFAFTIPMGYIRAGTTIEAQSRPIDSSERVATRKNLVSPDYFETMGIRVIRGRRFSDADNEQSRPVAIVNQRLGDMLWPTRDPIGQRFRSAGAGGSWVEVVGVTNTGKYEFLFEPPQPYFYIPIAQEYTGLRVLQVRTMMRPNALAPALEHAIHALEPNLPLYDVQTMRQALGSGLGFFPMRVAAASAAILGLLAFVLAIVGLYGVVSYLASQRTHEIGVRMAVGATQQDIVRLVVRDGLNLVGLGLAVGLLITLVSSRVVASFLFSISSRDPIVLVSVAPVLGSVAVIACAIPGWLAARIDPTIALRSE